MESEEESSARIIDNKFIAYIWLNSKLTKEGAGNSSSNYVNESRGTCSLLTAYKIIQRECKETTGRCFPVYQQRPDYQSKITWNKDGVCPC